MREYLRLLAALRPVVEAIKPAIQIKKSINEIVSPVWNAVAILETLVRACAAASLTPDGYRAKFGLPADAPMNTEAHAAVLSEKAANRGRRRSSKSRSATARGKPQSPEKLAPSAATPFEAGRYRRRSSPSARPPAARNASRSSTPSDPPRPDPR